ncbi:ammonia-dependent NAD(+) synthetase [Arcanobacterium pinnipediorum]|uniref:NH(3)-dependent NAD(+) synthetase n=1 Tax=Arcanobacterium pinnipediorum TaxID=1503041 RepID=A0ABY5AI44_9ACTO|nr:ammonia-dependent NAD(+) synthetase [Arcanobacterium pinnipediorum]USR78878.1 ammonia-dependent NAD(+) synthetase [Arcanobacterium pinnipediorum]
MTTQLQQHIISTLGVQPEIDPAEEVERRIEFLCDYAKATHTSGFVLGISGGVDSTLGGRLAQLAAQRLREEGYDASFTAVRLPYGIQADEADATQAMQWIEPDQGVTINIEQATDAMRAAYETGLGESITDFNNGNVKARMRMIAQFAIAGDHNLLVIGTDHAAENITGFFTKFGDGAADILPLAGLNKRQVRQLARYLGAPQHLWEKMPTADLLDETPGRADEDELGISYDQIDDYLEGKKIPNDVVVKLEQRWARAEHKRHTPVQPQDTWWRPAREGR